MKYSLSESLDRVRDLIQAAEQPLLTSYDGTDDGPDHTRQMAVSKLIIALMDEKAAFNLRPPISSRDVASELSRLFTQLRDGDFCYEHYRPVIQLILQKASDIDIWKAILTLIAAVSRTTPPPSVPPTFNGTPFRSTSSSQRGSEQTRELVEGRLFQEIKHCTHRDVAGFFETYFEGKDWNTQADDVTRRALGSGDDSGWPSFPNPPTQKDALDWWFGFQDEFLLDEQSVYVTTASKSNLTGKIRSKSALLQMTQYVREVFKAQPTHQFIHTFAVCGTKAEAWMFDRSGPFSSGSFDVNEDPKRFFQMIVGYTMMTDEELGLDTFITQDGSGAKTITIKSMGGGETVVQLNPKPLSYQNAIVCRGTACFLANVDDKVQGVAKFSWTSDKRASEKDLLNLAHERGVKGVAEVVGYCDITDIATLRNRLTFEKRHTFKSTLSSAKSSLHESHSNDPRSRSFTRLHPSTSAKQIGRKRKSPDKGTQASKRSRSSSQLSGIGQQENELTFEVQPVGKPSLFDNDGKEFYDNRILRCLVISPAGRPIYEYHSPTELLKSLRDAIKAHRSLYTEGNILHRDISENNIIITRKGGGRAKKASRLRKAREPL
uniref:non-specific serine/threonine protein kinase n=1 Tax=Coccidioides posadasii RMSCC 3488 TaxID=454284 RepID=A0A0J6IBB1_COCPO|nr:hypothetical protein CPAG_05260 [Coccidioides posadasii RMSCC 3488]